MADGYQPAFVRLRSRSDGRWLVHEELRPRLVADAERAGISLIDQAVLILAERFGVPFAATPRKTSPAESGEELNLNLPSRLHRKIKSSSPGARSVPDSIRITLSKHYGLPLPPKAQRASRGSGIES